MALPRSRLAHGAWHHADARILSTLLARVGEPRDANFSTQSYNNVPSEVQVTNFQKMPVVLSKRGAIAIESAFKIDDLRGLYEFDHVGQTRLKHFKN